MKCTAVTRGPAGTFECQLQAGHIGRHDSRPDGQGSGTLWVALPPHDPVDHPKHYNSHPSGIDCIVIARHHNFNIGNVFKYVWRAGLKTEKFGTADPNIFAAIEDLEKARWYLTDEINRLKEQK